MFSIDCRAKKNSLHRNKFDPISTDWKNLFGFWVHPRNMSPEKRPCQKESSVPIIISRFEVFARVPFPNKNRNPKWMVYFDWPKQVNLIFHGVPNDSPPAAVTHVSMSQIWESLPFQDAQLGKGTKSKIDLLKIQVLKCILPKMHSKCISKIFKNAFQIPNEFDKWLVLVRRLLDEPGAAGSPQLIGNTNITLHTSHNCESHCTLF